VSILYVLIPLSLVLMGAAAWAFLWAVDHGQFDDLEGAGRSILDEDAAPLTRDAGNSNE
jgi:cbb3-type cytochrome oxidase maturation protein